MAMTTASPTAYLRHNVEHSSFFPAKSRFRQFFPAKRASRFLAMAPKTKTSSRQTELLRSSDSQNMLEKKARWKEDTRARNPRRVSALQRLAPRTHGNVEVGMSLPRPAYEPTDKALARLQT
ncbi:hypothetical protein HYC85_029817 [Camellia sinensis]|uniref:Uncharacterized protein n=1 Tax=Camellia sinensis TaxID=4442 RepID=A0A7J7G305_CAMSI|nr:hypothetical protein HYC85_029817 [Camellia sinensis]